MTPLRPPRFAEYLLSRITPFQLKPTAGGDFEEIYRRIVSESGIHKAKCWYWKQTLFSAFPFFLTILHWRFTMIKEYLKLTLRHIRRRKGTAFVNIGGLAIGLAACILVFYFIRDELSYDRFHTHIDSIYELKAKVAYKSDTVIFVDSAGPAGPTLVSDFPEVESATRLVKSDVIIRNGDKIFKRKALGVDPSFFDVFTFPLVQSGASSPLAQPGSVVFSPETALLLFGSEDPMGKMITVKLKNEDLSCQVTGLVGNIPSDSSLTFDLLLPITQILGTEIDAVNTGAKASCFVVLKEGADPQAVEAVFPSTIDTFMEIPEGGSGGHYLFPFADYHRGIGQYSYSMILKPRSSPSHSFILAGIALLILLIAGFNFMNLSIVSAAAGRVKEIGMRKVLGAERKQLLRQFRFEGIVMCLSALLLGLAIAGFVLPVFNNFAGKEIRLDLLGPGFPGPAFLLFSIALGAAAGSYPGWFLARVHPVDLFRGKQVLGKRGGFNRVFLLLQFGISIFLVILTGFLYRQHRHLLKADLGYNPRGVIVLDLHNMTAEFQNTSNFMTVLKDRLKQYPEIKAVSGAYSGMTSWSAMIMGVSAEGTPDIIRFNDTDENYLDALGLQMLDGRWFSQDFPADLSEAVVVNEAFVKKYDIADPTQRRLSEFIRFKGPDRIIGVVSDFHYDSLRSAVEPAFMTPRPDVVQQVYILSANENPSRALEIIRREFTAAAPGYPFLFSFLDEEVASQYRDEKRWSLIVSLSCLFAILIACAGVFALALRTAARRTKEIGIRKVLGASVSGILGLLSAQFLRLSLLSALLAWPAAYLTVHRILADYPYRVSLSAWMFVAGAAIIAALTLVTVCLQAMRTAVGNPVESLRHE